MNSLFSITSQKNRGIHIDDAVAPNSFIERLPFDVMHVIYKDAELQDLRALGLTSRYFFSKIFSNSIRWDSLLEKYFPDSYANSPRDIKGVDLYEHLTKVERNRKIGKFQVLNLIGWYPSKLNCFFSLPDILIHGNRLIFGTRDRTIKIWDLKSRKEVQTLIGHEWLITDLCIHKDQLISASWEGSIKIWDLKNGKQIHELPGHEKPIAGIAMHGDQLIAAGSDGCIKIWDLTSGQAIRTLVGHQFGIRQILVHGDVLMSTSEDGAVANYCKIKVWDLNEGKEIHTFRGHPDVIQHMFVHKDQLISITEHGTITVWDLQSGKKIHTFNHSPERMIANPLVHGNHLISASLDCTIKIWDLSTGKEIKTLEHDFGVTDILTYENKLISTDSHRILIWDLNCAKESAPLPDKPLVTLIAQGRINHIVRQDNFLFAVSNDQKIEIWDLKTEKKIQQFYNSHGKIVSFFPHGGYLVTISERGTIKIRDFSHPTLSSYSKQLLEENFSMVAQVLPCPEIVEKLDPHFKYRLIQHSFNLRTPYTYSAKVISRVQTEICLETLLHAIHDEDLKSASRIFKQLSASDPKNCEIVKLFSEVYCRFDSENFAVVAFKKYLETRWGQDISLLLSDFGILSREEYAEHLGCVPEFLQKIGIQSLADLNVLGVVSFPLPGLQNFEITAEIPTTDQKQLQTRAFEKKRAVFGLLQNLSEALDQRLNEMNNCDLWLTFQEKLDSYKKALENQCQIPQTFLEKFAPEAYAKMVCELNGLIDAFFVLDRKHQIAKLRDYVDQQGILGAWDTLRERGIDNLTTLVQQTKIPTYDLFHVWE